MTKDELFKGTRILQNEGAAWLSVTGTAADYEQTHYAYVELEPLPEHSTGSTAPDVYAHPELAPRYIYSRLVMRDVDKQAALRDPTLSFLHTYEAELLKVKEAMWDTIEKMFSGDGELDRLRFVDSVHGDGKGNGKEG